MEYKLAKQLKTAHPTIIREIYMYACDHRDVFLDLSIGEPSVDTFPLKEIAKASADMYKYDGKRALAYGPYPGMDDIIEELTKWMASRGFDMEKNTIEILPGSGHGMDNMANTFCDEGDVILSEMMAYPGIQNAARMVGAKLIGVEMDDDGINLEALERKINENIERLKFLYLCPSFNNPTTLTLPEYKREAIYRLAQKYDFMIYEDDPYSRLSFDGNYLKEIKRYDTDGRVVYAASLSKIVSAGMRIGFFVVDKSLRQWLEMSQGNAGVQSVPVMLTVANYMKENDINAHCVEVGEFYRKKAEWMIECIKKYLPASCVPVQPTGGIFLWLNVPETLDLNDIFHKLMYANVGVCPSYGFSADPENYPGHGFRLCYSTPSREDIEKACQIMGKVLKEELGEE